MSAPRLFVRAEGRPYGQGSKNKGRGGSVYEASKYLKPWRDTVIVAVREALQRSPAFDTKATAYQVAAVFVMPRPKSHHVGNDRARPLRESAPSYCSTTPDVDKLSRAVLDALTQAGAIPDDRRVAHLEATKVYESQGGWDGPPGLAMTVGVLVGEGQ